MNKLAISLFIIPCLYGSEKQETLRMFVTTPEGQKIRLYHNTDGFFVKTNNKKETIEPAMMDKNLRNINNTQLKALLNNGSLKLNKTSDGTFALRAHVNGNGGGWFSGFVAYWTIKALGSAAYMIPNPAAAAAVETVAQAVSAAATNNQDLP